jgi:2-oxoglutarate ferredoxin oxidoreductase subunit delta
MSKVKLNIARCKGCGYCVEVNDELCIACGSCYRVCPDSVFEILE